MANDRNELNDLLENFEPTPKKPRKSSSGSGRVTPAPPPPVRRASEKAQAAEKKTYRNGVYFSNPPQKISQDAAKEKGGSGKKRSSRKVSYGGEKPKGNFIVRFFKSRGFRNFIIKLVIIAVVSSTLCFYGLGCINDVLAIDAEDVSVEVRVEEGMTDEQVIDLLKEHDLIRNPYFCKLFTKFFDVDGNYISGVYTLSPTLGVEKMMSTMKTDYKSSETIKLTFPEGWTIQQIAEKLESNEVCTASSFISTLQTVDFSNEYKFIKNIPDKDKKFRALEGYIYPDTYEFYKGENASSVVRRFLNNFQKHWTDKYQKKADKLGYSMDEIIIMASILQAEAANSRQMPKIASVLYNRLDRPSKYPRLECDSTEDYLLDTIKPSLTSSIEDTQKYIKYRDSYDTYSQACEGLPVGAIGNPGDAAISAALNPASTSYYYFRHDVNGGIYYANSFEQHEANGVKAAKVKKEEY